MKKKQLTALVLALSMLLVACGSSSADADTEIASSEAEQTVKEEESDSDDEDSWDEYLAELEAYALELEERYPYDSAGSLQNIAMTNEDADSVLEWTDIVKISAQNDHIVGLRSDGTVVAAGDNSFGQCDVDEWTDIVDIAAGYLFTAALTSDGTVIVIGVNDGGQCDLDYWGGWDAEIVAIDAERYHLFGLTADGHVVTTGYDIYCQIRDTSEWENVVSIKCGDTMSLGITEDQEILWEGYAFDALIFEEDDWDDVIAVAAGSYDLYAITEEGTLVTTYSRTSEETESITGLQDVEALYYGWELLAGVRSDGSVAIILEPSSESERSDFGDWTDIAELSLCSYYSFGLKNDGTVQYVGKGLD